MLALNTGHHVTKDRLVDCLWGERPPASAIPTLEAYVSLLRRRLDPTAQVASSALRTTNGGYALDTDRVRVDHTDFQRLLSGSPLEPAPVARQRLQQALNLAQSDLLESEPYVAWAMHARADVHTDIVSACEAAGLRALAGGDWADAASLVRRAMVLDPLAETCARILMEALWRDGRRTEALRVYGDLRRALADDLGSDPDARAHALYLQVLRATASAAPQALSVVTRLGSPAGVAQTRTCSTDSSASSCSPSPDRAVTGRGRTAR